MRLLFQESDARLGLSSFFALLLTFLLIRNQIWNFLEFIVNWSLIQERERMLVGSSILCGAEVDAAVASPGAVAAAVGGDQESEGEDPLLMFPAGGYWALQPGTRLRMLRSLCFDALETRAIRYPIQTSPHLTDCKFSLL